LDWVEYELMAIAVTSIYLSFMFVVYGPASRTLEGLQEKDFRCVVPDDWMIEAGVSGSTFEGSPEPRRGKKYD
jgi:hypothetical protein